MSLDELLGKLNERKLVIYGTGFASGMLCEALSVRGLEENIAAFTVTFAGGEEEFRDRPVISFSDLVDGGGLSDALILIAVHGSVSCEIEKAVQGSGMEYISVYPYIPDLLYGEPDERDAMVDTYDIISKQDPAYLWLAVRYALLLECGEGSGSEDGRAAGIYTKAIAMHTSQKTAEARRRAFIDLFRSIREDGYRSDSKILIDTDGRIIDGLHRVAAAAYCGIKRLPAKVYASSEVYDRVIKKENRMDESTLREGGLTDDDIRLIKEAGRLMQPEISVIIPAFNVGGYIDECMKGVTNQTFTDFEVILINDGSADDTPMKCRGWAAADGRIRYFSIPNGGVAHARNMGIEEARGKYLAFVDPDDRLDLRYLEKLHDAAIAEGADFSECDIMRCDSRTGKMIHRSCGGAFGVPFTKEEHMIYGPTASYKAISKRSLWTENGIRFPSCSFESPAVYSLIVALSEKTVNVPEALYYYTRYRDGSLIETGYAGKDGKADPELGEEAMRSLIREAGRLGLLEEYADTFERVVKYRLNDILAMQYHRRTKEEAGRMAERFRDLSGELFPGGSSAVYAVWGGYNLNRILLHLPMIQDPDMRMNFSAVASQAYGAKDGAPPEHGNRYRQMMLQREWRAGFFGMLREKRPDIFFMDLTEERNPLIPYGDGYITMSDAFCGSSMSGLADAAKSSGSVIEAGSAERLSVMEKAIPAFIDRVREAAPGIRICIVENYLAEKKGDIAHEEYHDGHETIRKVNSELEKYYGILKRYCKDAFVVEASKKEPYITDVKYEYGALPSHLNALVNRRIAKEAEKVIRDDRQIR